MRKSNGFVVELLIVVVIISVVISGFVFGGKEAKARGENKLNVVNQYLDNMETAFEHNESFSCINKKSQMFDNNVSKENGYVIKIDNSGPLKKITFLKENLFFTETQCESNGLLL